MIDHAALVHAVGDYAQALLTNFDIGSVLYRLTDHVTAVLGADGAGVSLTHDDRDQLAFVAATDGDVVAIEEQQIASQQGPCHEAFRTGELVVVTDLEHDERWPDYRPAAVKAGARAVLGVPMPVEARRIGALNVYRHTPHDWDDAEIEVAQALANMATGYVLTAGALERSSTLAAQLQHALDSRIIVEQAKGMLAERHQIPLAEAFHRLRGHARSQQLRVHGLAQDIVDGTVTL